MPTYTDFSINAPTEAVAKQAAQLAVQYDPTFTLLRPDGGWLLQTYRHSLDPIGTVYNDDRQIDPATGDELAPPTKRAGWFANLRVVSEIGPQVQQLLAAVGAPLGVTIVEDAGRVWA